MQDLNVSEMEILIGERFKIRNNGSEPGACRNLYYQIG